MRNWYLTGVLCVASAAMFACGDDDNGGDDNDSGVHSDGGLKPDAGSTGGLDAGFTMDSGVDAGQQPVDAGPNYADAAAGTVIAKSVGNWVVFSDPFGDGTANPAQSITGSAQATADGKGGMTVQLVIKSIAVADHAYGAHLHVLTCEDMMAGGHYEDMLAADGSLVPSAANEVWLDFRPEADGAATVMAKQSWIPRHGQANAIVVHSSATQASGAAGKKLACLNIPF